jgi:hypothetical protein
VTPVVAYEPEPIFACTYPAVAAVAVCGADHPEGTATVTAASDARPPVATVYVRISVFAVDPATVVVGAIDAVPDPSVAFVTVTDGLDPSAVRVPVDVDFSVTAHDANPAFAADGATAAPPLEPIVSP